MIGFDQTQCDLLFDDFLSVTWIVRFYQETRYLGCQVSNFAPGDVGKESVGDQVFHFQDSLEEDLNRIRFHLY
jgi:hypothetical protein